MSLSRYIVLVAAGFILLTGFSSGIRSADRVEVINRLNGVEEINIYRDRGFREVLTTVEDGEEVEIISTHLDGHFRIQTDSGQQGYIDSRFLKTAETNIPLANPEELENLDYRLLFSVSQKEQKLYIYSLQDKENHEYELEEVLVSTGIDQDPTPNGYFTIKERRGEWFYNPNYESGGRYFVEFRGSYLLHSVGYNEDREIIPERLLNLGRRQTRGCVAMPVSAAEYVYQEAEPGMLLVINYNPLTPEEILTGRRRLTSQPKPK